MFEKIIGNQEIKVMLTKSIENETTSHSYLFIGTQGIGKKMLAIQFAKRILCFGKEQECSCKSCLAFEGGNHPDYLCVKPEGNSIKIEQIRFLQKKIQEKPIIADKKVYIIDEADSMTQEAQNCLLKTLEEPPQFAIIVLIGSEENLFLPTIKSRCMILKFKPIQNEEMKRYLEVEQKMSNLTPNRLDMFQGSIGKAIALKDKQEEYDKIETMVNQLNIKDLIEIIQLAEPLYKAKEDVFKVLEYINLLLLKQAKENYLYTNCIKIVEDTKKRLNQNGNYDMCIDYLLFNMKEELSKKIDVF